VTGVENERPFLIFRSPERDRQCERPSGTRLRVNGPLDAAQAAGLGIFVEKEFEG